VARFVFTKHGFAIPRRDAPELMQKSFAQKTEGVGNAGCTVHPQPVCIGSKHTVVTAGHRETPGIPARNGFNGLYRALPGDEFVLSPSSAD
jgi:hypothetical protein